MYNGYKIAADYDTTQYCSMVSMSKNGIVTVLDSCTEKVEDISDYDFEGNGERTLIIDFFTGGAHCCDYLVAGTIKNDKFVVEDTLYWGDSGCEIKDIDKDGKIELSGYDTRFGYAFTSFAGSRFPVIIFQFRKGKFINVTKKFPDLVEKDLAELKKELDEDYLKMGYKCPEQGQDMYSTESGEVQAILAAMTEDYYNLGRIDDAYEYINKVYKCDDKKKFIKTLKEDYKLK
jgi:hypothetical protein